MLNKKHLIYQLIKLGAFTALAVLVFVFRNQQVEHLKPFIGSLMLLYGIEGLFYEIFFHHLHFIHEPKSYLGLIEIIFGIVLITSPLQFEYVCIIWATWSIVRESYELKELVSDYKTLLPKILSGVESITVIVFSVLLILEPGEHHAIIHMCLLTAELILNPLVVVIDEWLIYLKEKKKAEASQE